MNDAERAHTQTERIAFFSDAVFAIAITLLVLEIKVPHLEPGAGETEAWRALAGLALKMTGFVASFLVVGAFWLSHHRAFGWLRESDDRLAWRNLFLLLTVSFIPFPTAFFSEYPGYRASLQFYAASLVLLGLAQRFLWAHALTARFLAPGVTAAEVARLKRRSWGVPIVGMLAILVAGWSLTAARLSLLLIPVAVVALDRAGRGAGSREPRGDRSRPAGEPQGRRGTGR
jgi:uncharacterized membrane protein